MILTVTVIRAIVASNSLVGVPDMGHYRLYFLDETERNIGLKEFDCSDDENAVAQAEQFKNGTALELWSGERFVARVLQKERSCGT